MWGLEPDLTRADEPHPDLFNTALMFRRGGTSSRAAAGAAERAERESTHKRIWNELKLKPRTADEIARDMRMERNTARARISELYTHGWAAPTGDTRPTPSGKPAEVWKAVDKDPAFPPRGSFAKKLEAGSDGPAEAKPMEAING